MKHLQRSLTLIVILISSTQLYGMCGCVMKQSLCNLGRSLRRPLPSQHARHTDKNNPSPALLQQYKALQETKHHTQHQLYNVLDKHGRTIQKQASSSLYSYLRANLSLHKERCRFLAEGIASLREAEEIGDAIHYKGYRWQVIKYNPIDDSVHAQISGIAIADALGLRFQASTPQAFTQAFHAVVDTYIKQRDAILNAG